MQELPMLDRVYVASPCTASWDEMPGDERKRFCGECQKHVYNFSGMKRAEIETLLSTDLAKGREVCGRLYRRRDGTILTADCPTGKSRARRFLVMQLGMAASVLLAVPAVAGAIWQAKVPQWTLWDKPPYFDFAVKVGWRKPVPPPSLPVPGGLALLPPTPSGSGSAPSSL